MNRAQVRAEAAEQRSFDMRSAIAANYRFHLISSTLFRAFTAWRAKCGNDAESLYIYTAFMLAIAAEAVKPTGAGGQDDTLRATVSAFSISDMTGIPRETVRRKLRMLVDYGMLTRGPGSAYSLVLDRRTINGFVERIAQMDVPAGWEAVQ